GDHRVGLPAVAHRLGDQPVVEREGVAERRREERGDQREDREQAGAGGGTGQRARQGDPGYPPAAPAASRAQRSASWFADATENVRSWFRVTASISCTV